MFIAKSRDLERFAFTDGVPTFAPLSMAASVALPGIMPTGVAMRPAALLVKRGEDIVIAGAALVILSPVMLLAAVLIRLTSPGPVFFRQQRVGRNGSSFTMLKFRSMHIGADRWPGLRQATRHDERVTRFGAYLRHTSIDELPQLFNVLRGEMSLVGPRPHAPGTCAGGRPFEQITHRYGARHTVKPGMTGLAQVRGWRGETDTEDKLLHRLDSDLEYIATWSLLSDLRILLRTAGAVLRMRNAY